MENLMRLAAAFKYEDLHVKSSADNSFRMTALLSAIKPATFKVLVISLGYHTCYLILRLVVRKDRPLAINAYYGFQTSNSPIYEMINLSQVSLDFACVLLTERKHQLPAAYSYAVLSRVKRYLLLCSVSVKCLQFLMTFVCFPLFFGSTSLYVYVITIACSQLEKLKSAIININRNRDDQEKGQRQVVLCDSHYVSRNTEEQIADCIRHHQQILEYDTPNICLGFRSRVADISALQGYDSASLGNRKRSGLTFKGRALKKRSHSRSTKVPLSK